MSMSNIMYLGYHTSGLQQTTICDWLSCKLPQPLSFVFSMVSENKKVCNTQWPNATYCISVDSLSLKDSEYVIGFNNPDNMKPVPLKMWHDKTFVTMFSKTMTYDYIKVNFIETKLTCAWNVHMFRVICHSSNIVTTSSWSWKVMRVSWYKGLFNVYLMSGLP